MKTKIKKKALKFARKNDYADVDYLGIWREMDIFRAVPESDAKKEDNEGDEEPPAEDLPQFIVVIEGEPLWADHLDTFAIMRHFHC